MQYGLHGESSKAFGEGIQSQEMTKPLEGYHRLEYLSRQNLLHDVNPIAVPFLLLACHSH